MKELTIHRFDTLPAGIVVPHHINNPFHYDPHPLCVIAADMVADYILQNESWHDELEKGKMFGVLVIRDHEGKLGFLAAYSGLLDSRNNWPFFVPPIFDFQQPEGYFKREEAKITEINNAIDALKKSDILISARLLVKEIEKKKESEVEAYRQEMAKAKQNRNLIREKIKEGLLPSSDEEKLVAESQYMKAEMRRLKKRLATQTTEAEAIISRIEQQIVSLQTERHRRSDALQRWLFDNFIVTNALGKRKTLTELFINTPQGTPPAGAGECCAPKLLQAAYINGLQPICMAEFWWGKSPLGEIRHHKQFYPACRSKCLPILPFMLQGLDVEQTVPPENRTGLQPEIVYQDESIVVVNKPAGLLSVPGKETLHSVESYLRDKYPQAEGPIIVHRLDMDTSGLMVAALTKEAHKLLQMQFVRHETKKQYVALLDGLLPNDKPTNGIISLPLAPDISDRPRQIVDYKHGKKAITRYQVISVTKGRTCICLSPETGRTHQLRMHCAHKDGLGTPILGDPLYGKKAERLYLHASLLEINHPITKKRMIFKSEPEFL